MNKKLSVILSIAAIILVAGLFASQASADSGFGMISGLTNGMMGAGFNAEPMNSMMNGAFGGMMHNMAGFEGMMNGLMHGNGSNMNQMHRAMHGENNIDMNAMHKMMHGENTDYNMNDMHARMLAGNLTQEDYNGMKEHCPMMG